MSSESSSQALIISNVNMAPLAPLLEDWTVAVSEYDDYMLQLIDPESQASHSENGLILALLDGELFFAAGRDLEEYVAALRGFCARHPKKRVLVNSFCLPAETIATYSAARSAEAAPQSLEARANLLLQDVAAEYENVLLLDMGLLYRRFGYQALTSASFWYLGRIRYTQLMMRELARHVGQLLGASAGRARKVLVLDLDGTLWGGVIGEDGLEGIEISEDGKGKIFRDFQKAIKMLRARGVLLAVCSKNNPADIDERLWGHAMMVLCEDDFAVRQINWDDKSENMLRIAKELDLGLDSMVFVDDSPAERANIRAQLPEVAVPEFPEKIEDLPLWFVRDVVFPCFPSYGLTDEDRARTHRYQTRRRRAQVAAQSTREEFLRSLDMRLNCDLDPAEHVQRAMQLTQRTNQFNLTTRRYSLVEIRAAIEDSRRSVILMEYEDRFGKEGIIGLAIADLERAEIETLLLSCRVIGRGVEDTLLAHVEAVLRQAGQSEVRAQFIPTAKNAPARQLLPTNGYRLKTEDDDGTCRFTKELGS